MKKLMTVVCLFITAFCFAQQKRVTGVVTNKSDGLPLPGVTITGSNNNIAATDSSGVFSINAATGETLTFSFVGMKTATATVPASGRMSVALADDATDLNQVVSASCRRSASLTLRDR